MNADKVQNKDALNYCLLYNYINDRLKMGGCDFCVFFTQHLHDFIHKSCECGVSITQWKKSGIISMAVDGGIHWQIKI
jgi:hypothetical protein